MRIHLIIGLLLLSTSALAVKSDFYALFSPHQGEEAFQTIYQNISNARKQVYATIYSWSDTKVKTAFADAITNGAEVKILLHPSLMKKSRVVKFIDELELMGAEVKQANRNMHEKFLIIDGKWLMNSSANMSGGAKNKYSENFVFHSNKTLAGRKLISEFKDEFAVLWNAGKDYFLADEDIALALNIDDRANLPEAGNPVLYSSSMNFTLKDYATDSRSYEKGQYVQTRRRGGTKNQTWKVTDMIISKINAAQKNIYVNLNHLNIEAVAQALLDASKRKVDVRLVVDNQEFKTTTKAKEKTPFFVSEWKKLTGNSDKIAPVRVKYYSHIPSPRFWFLNHHKYFLIDYNPENFSDTILITGSHNISRTAEHNQYDNQVVYAGADFSGLHKAFKAEFDRLWSLNRNEDDKPVASVYKKLVEPYKDSISIHSKNPISLTWKEVKKVRSTIYSLAPKMFRNSYKNRDCMYFGLETQKFYACPKR